MLLVTLPACQPTPKKEVVVGRQEDILENVTSVPLEDFNEIEVPEHVCETFEDFKKLKVTFNADVIVPDATAYPVTEVNKRIFSDDELISFIELLTGNKELYSEWNLTKEEWQQMITEVKPFVASGQVSHDWLDTLEDYYDKATTNAEKPLIEISELSTDTFSTIYVPTDSNSVSKCTFERDGNQFIYYRNMFLEAYPASLYAKFDEDFDTKENFKWMQPGEPEISQEDAYDKALEYLSVMNIDLNLYSAELCTVLVNQVKKSAGWEFTFTRSISNLMTQFHNDGTMVNPDSLPSYGAPWEREVLKIVIDNEGLCKLMWQGASEISSADNESAQLEPFEEIIDRIANQLNYILGTQDRDGIGVEIEVTKIELGISLISVKNQINTGVYIPTWYINFKSKWSDENEDGWFSEQIMFSALDGSYIEPRITNVELMDIIDN